MNCTDNTTYIPGQKKITPTGTIEITENGTFDVTQYANADVNVSGGGSSYELIASGEIEVSTTSAQIVEVGVIPCGESAWTSDDIIFVHVYDKAGARDGYFFSYFAYVVNVYAKNGATTNYNINGLCNGVRISPNGNRILTGTSYGVYPALLSANGDLTIKARYGNVTSGEIDGTYQVDVYKLSMPNKESPLA